MKKENYEDLIRFVLEKYGLSGATFNLIILGEEEWRQFLIGQYFFEHPSNSIEYEKIERRMIEEYGFSPDLESILELQYAQCAGIDDKNLIKEWLSIHERNKQNLPYSQSLATYLNIFFKQIKELLSYDFLIIYNPQKLTEFFPKKKRGKAIIEETLHFCYKKGKKVPIKHNEVARLSKKILKEYGTRKRLYEHRSPLSN